MRILVNYVAIVGSRSRIPGDRHGKCANVRYKKEFNEFAVEQLVVIDTPTLEERQHG